MSGRYNGGANSNGTNPEDQFTTMREGKVGDGDFSFFSSNSPPPESEAKKRRGLEDDAQKKAKDLSAALLFLFEALHGDNENLKRDIGEAGIFILKEEDSGQIKLFAKNQNDVPTEFTLVGIKNAQSGEQSAITAVLGVNGEIISEALHAVEIEKILEFYGVCQELIKANLPISKPPEKNPIEDKALFETLKANVERVNPESYSAGVDKENNCINLLDLVLGTQYQISCNGDGKLQINVVDGESDASSLNLKITFGVDDSQIKTTRHELEMAEFNRITRDDTQLTHQHVESLAGKTFRENFPQNRDFSKIFKTVIIKSDHSSDANLISDVLTFVGSDEQQQLSLAVSNGVDHWTALHLRKEVGQDGKIDLKSYYADSLDGSGCIDYAKHALQKITYENLLPLVGSERDAANLSSAQVEFRAKINYTGDIVVAGLRKLQDINTAEVTKVACTPQNDYDAGESPNGTMFSCGYRCVFNLCAMAACDSTSELDSRGFNLDQKGIKYGGQEELPVEFFIPCARDNLKEEFNAPYKKPETSVANANGGRKTPPQQLQQGSAAAAGAAAGAHH